MIRRLLTISAFLALGLAVAACLPGTTALPTPRFIPLTTPTAGTTEGSQRQPGMARTPGAGDIQRQRPPFTPGAGSQFPIPSGTPRPGMGVPFRTQAATPTVEAATPTATPAPAVTPTPTPTSIIARFLATPTPVPPTPTPTPMPPLTGRIVYQTATGGDIVVVNVDGSGQRVVGQGMDPAWSPDGTKIAFTRWEEPKGIFVVNADGSDLRRVYDIQYAKSPTWSPDGTRIVFALREWRTVSVPRKPGGPGGTRQQETWELYVVNLLDGNMERVPTDGEMYAFAPAWSSQGTIAYKGTRGLYGTRLGDQAWIIYNIGQPNSPAWSPDGSRLAFMQWQNDHWDIFVMNADGSGIANLTKPDLFQPNPPDNVAPVWSPDGRYIAFLTDREGEGQWRIYVMSADGSGQRRLLDTHLPIKYDYAGERVLSWTR